jgi:putative transposase
MYLYGERRRRNKNNSSLVGKCQSLYSVNQNSRNGYNNKTLKSKYGQIDVSIPRDRDASFDPKLVKKRETILAGSEDLIISLYTKGMSIRDIQNHLDDLYGVL